MDIALSVDKEFNAFVPDISTKYEWYLCQICPALRICLSHMREVRGQNQAMFVHFDLDKADRLISKQP